MSEEGKSADQKLQLTATFGSGYTLREDALTSESVVHRVLQTGRAEIVNNIPASHFLEAEADAQISVLSAPLKTEKRVLGVIILISEQREFTAHDLRLLNTIAMQAAPTIEITHLYQLAVEKARMERELQIARQVQVGLLPSSTPSLPGYEFAGYWRPAREVSGDYYDFIREQEDRMGLVIADVTDKGMPASLFMVFARSAVRSSIGRYSSPMRAIQQANQLICSESSYGLFTTLFYARLFTKTGRITYVNAGHNPPLYYQARPDKIKPLIRTGIPLGIFDDSTYSQRTIQLDANDFIFCYTDGLTEAINEQGEDFGMQRLQTVIYENRGASAQTIVNALSGAIDEFAGPAPPFDDFTMMVVKRV
jgi:sigma-B regulation protein RsbU (phosphoserine phosphatase)